MFTVVRTSFSFLLLTVLFSPPAFALNSLVCDSSQTGRAYCEYTQKIVATPCVKNSADPKDKKFYIVCARKCSSKFDVEPQDCTSQQVSNLSKTCTDTPWVYKRVGLQGGYTTMEACLAEVKNLTKDGKPLCPVNSECPATWGNVSVACDDKVCLSDPANTVVLSSGSSY